MEQLGLTFEPVRARRADPETSQISAGLVREFEADHHAKILKALEEGDGTIWEIADRTDGALDHVQVARRMTALEQVGRVRVVVDETRPSPKGRPCRVWRLA